MKDIEGRRSRRENEELYQRLESLEGAGLIEKRVAEQTEKIIRLIYSGKPEVDAEKMEIFVTHIAMAMQRILNGQKEEPLSEAVLKELQEEASYENAKSLAQKVYETVNIEFPMVEQEYLIVHLCNLFS